MAKKGAPKEGEFEEGKIWFRRRGKTITLGLTAAGVAEVGEVERIEMPGLEDRFDKGDVCLTVEGSNGNLEVPTPATGTVSSVNDNLNSAPELASEDSDESGWLIEIDIEDSTELMEYGEDEPDIEIGSGED